jgi:hypothetical protein
MAELPTIKGTSSSAQVDSGKYIGSISPSPEMGFVKAEYNRLRNEIGQQIKTIAEKPLEVDAGALTGKVMESFEQFKKRSVETATASVKKAASDLDAYFGSASSNVRGSGQRALMASSVKGAMLREVYGAIGSVYEKSASDAIAVGLEAAKVNVQAAAVKAEAISSLYAQGVEMFKATSSLFEQDYQTRLQAAISFAELDAKARGDELARDTANLQAAVSLLGNKNYGISGFMRYGLPTTKSPGISTTMYDVGYKPFAGGFGQSGIQRV